MNPMNFQYQIYNERLIGRNWTMDPETWSFRGDLLPIEYCSGVLAEGWDWSDPQTLTVRIRKGVFWHDMEPVNGREFTAQDVQHHYDQLLGTGSGYAKPNPIMGGWYTEIERVMAKEFISGSSLTFSRNPKYYGYDERHPDNRLPYMDSIKFVAIADMATAIAALRTGRRICIF